VLSKSATTTPDTSVRPRLLIVDDEKDNLEALRRLLRGQYDVEITTSPFEALKWIQTGEFNVIVSDQRMPEMTGVELLEKAKHVRPAVTRILLTGYTDIDSVISAINRGNIYRYVAKPWDPEDLKLTLKQANEAYLLRREVEQKSELLERSNAELRVALEDLRQLDRAKARFLSLVSHELNTPLTILSSFTSLLNDKGLPPEFKKPAESIQKASDRLSQIVDEVLTFVRLESQPDLKIEEMDLKKTFDRLAKEWEKRGRKIEAKVEGTTTWPCDIAKVELAFRRLIEDAHARATPGSPLKIEALAKGKSLSVTLTRDGEPLSSDAFKPLETAASELHHHKNLGLALATCKWVMDAHRGEIEARGEKGRSSITLMFHQR